MSHTNAKKAFCLWSSFLFATPNDCFCHFFVDCTFKVLFTNILIVIWLDSFKCRSMNLTKSSRKSLTFKKSIIIFNFLDLTLASMNFVICGGGWPLLTSNLKTDVVYLISNEKRKKISSSVRNLENLFSSKFMKSETNSLTR